MRSRILFMLITLFFAFSASANSSTIDSLLRVLDATIQQGAYFQQIREDRIQGIKDFYKKIEIDNEQQYFFYSRIYDEYRAYQFDSALHYLNLKTKAAKESGNIRWKTESQIQQIRLFIETGMHKEAFDAYSRIERSAIDEADLARYYSILAQLFSQYAFYTRIASEVSHYRYLERTYRDSALNTYPQGSFNHLQELEIYYYGNWESDKAIETALNLLQQTETNNPRYAFFAYRVARNYLSLGNKEKEKEYLIRSAISDIQNGIKDNASLSMLAVILFYDDKNINKAYEYIQFSLADAGFYNAPLRIIELSNVLPVINEAYNLKLEKQRNQLQLYLILIGFLIIFLFVSLFFIIKQLSKLSKARVDLQIANQELSNLNHELSQSNNKLNHLNNQLSETNKIKEQYIGLFLDRCSSYIDKLKDYQKFVNKQIAARKIQELYDSTKSKKLVDDELREFYETFDHTFLILFPNFVEQLNALLNENEKIELREGELLNTELRIFALIRLGISDSSQIASLLRYAVNTIYNYRVKIKNKSSIPRDEFEARIKEIGVVNS